MEEKVLKKIKGNALFSLIITILAVIAALVFASPAEYLTLGVMGTYLLLAFLRLSGKKTEVKDLKNLLVYTNILMVCFNLIKLIFIHDIYSGWDLLVSFVLVTYYMVNTVYVYGLFRGKMGLDTKVINTSAILQVALILVAAVMSRQYWAWGNVAFAVAAFTFTRYLIRYRSVANNSSEYNEEALRMLGVNEDNAFRCLTKSKKIWKNVGHVVLALVVGLVMAIEEWVGVVLMISIILFVAPLIYIYRLGNAIGEPKGMLYISYFIPLVGMILYLIYVRNVKALGNACGKAALLGLIMPVAAVVLMAGVVYGMMASTPIVYIPMF